MTERAKYWATQLASWERSGLTQAEYCRRRRIKAGSFAWWKRLKPQIEIRSTMFLVTSRFRRS